MADLEATTKNANDTGNVDELPSSAVTGYQNQNSLAVARALGEELTTVTYTASGIVVDSKSGTVEVNGLSFTMVDEVTFPLSNFSDNTISYIKVIDTDEALEKDLSLTTVTPTWNAEKHAWETSTGERVLGWSISRQKSQFTIRRLSTHGDANKDTGQQMSGIGLAGKRFYTSPGSYALRVARTGVYSCTAIGGGEEVDDIGDDSGGSGGSCIRAEFRVEAGKVFGITVGDANEQSEIVAGSSGLIQAPPNTGASIVGEPISYDTWEGGKAIFENFSKYRKPGGGAGPFGDGYDATGVDGFGSNGYTTGVSQVGKYGEGNGGTGFCQIEWISD